MGQTLQIPRWRWCCAAWMWRFGSSRGMCQAVRWKRKEKLCIRGTLMSGKVRGWQNAVILFRWRGEEGEEQSRTMFLCQLSCCVFPLRSRQLWMSYPSHPCFWVRTCVNVLGGLCYHGCSFLYTLLIIIHISPLVFNNASETILWWFMIYCNY